MNTDDALTFRYSSEISIPSQYAFVTFRFQSLVIVLFDPTEDCHYFVSLSDPVICFHSGGPCTEELIEW